jgi:hypothetical protein
MLKEVMNDLWLARISSLSNEVGLYVVLLEVWIKREVDQDPELESLSNWVRTIRSLVPGRIHQLKNCVNGRPKSVFKDQEAVKCLSSLHDKYVIAPADKASNNIVFVASIIILKLCFQLMC